MTEADVLERLDAVERDNARLRRLSIALIVLVAVLAGLAVAIMVVSARYGLPGTTADIVNPTKTPMANLLVSVLETMQVPIDKIGDSTGKVAI